MNEYIPNDVDSHLCEIEKQLSSSICELKSERDISECYHNIMDCLVKNEKVSSHAIGSIEITDDYIGLTFAYRPNLEYFHKNNLQEQPRFIFKRKIREVMSIEDMVSEADEFFEQSSDTEKKIKTDEKDASGLLEEIDEILGEI